MIRLGETQELKIVKKVGFGVYLSPDAGNADERVLLPAKQVPADSSLGDGIYVFVYRDSRDRLIATVREPKLKMGRTAELTVAQVGRIGAFLDWGLEKDLLLPFKEQRGRVEQGQKVLVSLYIDKSNRLCATMNVYKNLRNDSPYKTGDQITGRVYEISDNYGAFVAVDNIYSGLIPLKEMYGQIELGRDIAARVVRVLPDGRLNLSIREKAYLQVKSDTGKLLELLESYEGSLPFNDKAAPEVIRHETGMSKNEFKRAVGRLLKQGKIQIDEKTIRRIK